MNSKERVIKSINHEKTDRVPFMYRDVPEVRTRLKKHLNLKTDDELFEYLDIDFRWVAPNYIGPELELNNGNKLDIWGVEWKYTKFSKGAGYWNENDYPLKDIHDPEELENFNLPKLEWFDFSTLEEQCDIYKDYAIMTAPGIASPGIFQSPVQPLIGVERSLTEAYLNPDFLQKLIDKILEFQIPFIEKMLSAAKGKINFFRLGDDFGTQTGLLMDVEMWKEFIQPAFIKMSELAKKYGARYYQHSCGSIRDLIPAFIEAGVDVLDPIQVKAKNMQPSELKASFGDKLTFSGGVDEQELLPNGSTEDVKKGVKKLLDEMAGGGGFFLGPTHNFQDDISTENILAMYEAGKEWSANKA